MSTTKILIIKFLMTVTFAAVTLSILRGNEFIWIFLIALATTVVNYLVGDLLILPSFGNTVGAVGDGLTAAVIAHIAGVVVLGFRTSLTTIVLFAILLAVGEYFLHPYILRSRKVTQ